LLYGLSKRTIIALALFSKPKLKAKGVPLAVTGIGEEPVVSMQIP